MAIISAKDNNMNVMAVHRQLHCVDNVFRRWNLDPAKWEANGRPKWLRTGTTDGSWQLKFNKNNQVNSYSNNKINAIFRRQLFNIEQFYLFIKLIDFLLINYSNKLCHSIVGINFWSFIAKNSHNKVTYLKLWLYLNRFSTIF